MGTMTVMYICGGIIAGCLVTAALALRELRKLDIQEREELLHDGNREKVARMLAAGELDIHSTVPARPAWRKR